MRESARTACVVRVRESAKGVNKMSQQTAGIPGNAYKRTAMPHEAAGGAVRGEKFNQVINTVKCKGNAAAAKAAMREGARQIAQKAKAYRQRRRRTRGKHARQASQMPVNAHR